ncbi:MAG: lipopolysaccharide transport periplasmic protein LptA [Marinibacterium sp.]|nr:lipopolysaccharide transport periplasmic protein LptA [Marinibacterium sp.]
MVFAACLSVGMASAQTAGIAFGSTETDSTLPVEVTSKTLDVDQTGGTALFTGDVVVIQGPMKLNADKVLATYDTAASEIREIEATGNVIMVNGPDKAEADHALYTLASGVVVLTDNVFLTRTANVITGDFATIYLDSGTAEVEGNVKTLFIPAQDE